MHCDQKTSLSPSSNALLDFIEPPIRCSRLHLWRAAQASSSLAKIAFPRERRRLYAVKNRCLARLLEYGELDLYVDSDRSFGLLSVNLKGHAGRLHTHEGWLANHHNDRAA